MYLFPSGRNYSIWHHFLVYMYTDSGRSYDVFVGYTDRAVGAYRWNNKARLLVALTERLPLAGQVVNTHLSCLLFECDVHVHV